MLDLSTTFFYMLAIIFLAIGMFVVCTYLAGKCLGKEQEEGVKLHKKDNV